MERTSWDETAAWNAKGCSARIIPDVFHRVEFGGAWRQSNEGDLFANGEVFGDVIAGAVEDDGDGRRGRTENRR